MTSFIHIQNSRDFARVDGVNWFLEGYERTLADFDEGKLTLDESTTALAAELSDLAADSGGRITRALAKRACEALGYTVACTIFAADPDDAEDGDLIDETVEDLDATIEMLLTGEVGSSADLVAGARRLLKSASLEPLVAIASAEHFGDLFLAAADLVVATLDVTEGAGAQRQ